MEMLSQMNKTSPEEAEIINCIEFMERFGGGMKEIDNIGDMPEFRFQMILKHLIDKENKKSVNEPLKTREFFG